MRRRDMASLRWTLSFAYKNVSGSRLGVNAGRSRLKERLGPWWARGGERPGKGLRVMVTQEDKPLYDVAAYTIERTSFQGTTAGLL